MKHVGKRKVLISAMAMLLVLALTGAALAGSYPSPAFVLPGVKERPQETKAPETTAAPEATEIPEQTAAPEQTAEPDATPAPEATEDPDVHIELEATAEPEATIDPEATVESEASVDPEATVEPETDTGSEVTINPEPSTVPEASPEATPLPTEEPVEEEPMEEEPVEEEPAAEPAYTYERDEDGNLILDENGDPIVNVPEGWDIPVKFLRDENGNLVLDENGNPVIEQTVPAGSQLISQEANVLNPDRSINTYLSTSGPIYFGDPVTFVTVLYGYENVSYTLQWQQSDGGAWYDLPGQNGTSLTIIASEENCTSSWRICVNIVE